MSKNRQMIDWFADSSARPELIKNLGHSISEIIEKANVESHLSKSELNELGQAVATFLISVDRIFAGESFVIEGQTN